MKLQIQKEGLSRNKQRTELITFYFKNVASEKKSKRARFNEKRATMNSFPEQFN
jgi:hypothetical protein